ncbi:MAG: 50S ribosomal protein L18 [Candidatus Nomurabacteria bacterium]|nr:MAG: 50S ribosomal protein L18 [Candidatus Nomurabacteria bacterium]
MHKQAKLQRRKRRVRARVSGTAERPRLSVSRSVKHVLVQLIDDTTHRTLLTMTDRGAKDITGTKTERARELGKRFAKAAQEKGLTQAVFDRGGRLYHGRVQAIAEGAREAGLKL